MFVGYVFTRMLSTPLDNQDVGNWGCILGLAALFVEGLTVAVAAYAFLSVGWRPWSLSGSATGPAKSHDELRPGSAEEPDDMGFQA